MQSLDSFFSTAELKTIQSLNTPWKVQCFITQLSYNAGDRISISDAFRLRKGDCLEAAALASLILSYHNIENFIMDLTSVRDEDHVLCVFKVKNRFGAIAQSKFLGLRYRNPVYSSLRELAMSYFESYFNFFGEYTLRGHSAPLYLKNITLQELKDAQFVITLEHKLNRISHIALVDKHLTLQRVTPLNFNKELIVKPKGVRVGKAYR